MSIHEATPASPSDSHDRIALANRMAGRHPTTFSTWARLHVPVQEPLARD
jgi:hypothetical protein